MYVCMYVHPLLYTGSVAHWCPSWYGMVTVSQSVSQLVSRSISRSTPVNWPVFYEKYRMYVCMYVHPLLYTGSVAHWCPSWYDMVTLTHPQQSLLCLLWFDMQSSEPGHLPLNCIQVQNKHCSTYIRNIRMIQKALM